MAAATDRTILTMTEAVAELERVFGGDVDPEDSGSDSLRHR